MFALWNLPKVISSACLYMLRNVRKLNCWYYVIKLITCSKEVFYRELVTTGDPQKLSYFSDQFTSVWIGFVILQSKGIVYSLPVVVCEVCCQVFAFNLCWIQECFQLTATPHAFFLVWCLTKENRERIVWILWLL